MKANSERQAVPFWISLYWFFLSSLNICDFSRGNAITKKPVKDLDSKLLQNRQKSYEAEPKCAEANFCNTFVNPAQVQ